MKILFGKYKGRELSDVPLDYLQWVLRAVTSISEPYRGVILRKVERREADSSLRVFRPVGEPSLKETPTRQSIRSLPSVPASQ